MTKKIVVTTVHAGPGGGAYFHGQDVSGEWVRVKADYDRVPRPPERGETWQVTGNFVFDERFGNQLHAELCVKAEPTGPLLVRYLCAHPNFRGIGVGAGKIAKLYQRFGDELRRMLEEDDLDSLAGVLTTATAEKLLDRWHASSQEASVVAFLDKHKADSRLALKILKYWGKRAVEKLRENPYRLLAISSWRTVDEFARNLGVSPDDQRRLIAAVEAWTYYRLDERGDTLTDEAGLLRGVTRLTKLPSLKTAEGAVELALQDKAIVGDSAFGYQPVGCAVMERTIAAHFALMLRNGKAEQIDLFGNSGKNWLVDQQIENFQREEGIELNIEQRRAVHMAATSPLSVLKGGAGVGKTTVLKVIHQAVEAMYSNVFQMALAGRAAQRMREATSREAYTIAGFLNQLQNKKIQPRPKDLLIIDESSMLDLILMYRLLKYIPEGVRVLFTGDPYQLPLIGPGLVFHVLANDSSVPTTELIRVHRQAESTGIPRVASQVRKGEVPDLNRYEGVSHGVSFIECPQSFIVRRLVAIIEDLGGFRETQILGVLKDGVAGVRKINDTFHHEKTKGQPSIYGWGLAETDPVIYTKNDYERELFNGSLGKLEQVMPLSSEAKSEEEQGGAVKAIASFDGRRVELSNEDLGHVELAYAVTVHKAQGSQFGRVAIPITRSRLLDRTLVYTALTRGIEQVVFLGDRQAFDQAVINPPSASRRKVGLSLKV